MRYVVAIGLNDASPYPMGGEPVDVIEDIHRRGGMAVVARPGPCRKPELQWRPWDTPYDGVEWLNADSEWRDQSNGHLAVVAARLLLRPPETIASLFRRPTPTLRRWDATLRRRPVVGLAGLDAHANLAGWPRYVDMFRTARPFAGRCSECEPLSPGAQRCWPEDAAAILSGTLGRGQGRIDRPGHSSPAAP